MLDGVSAVPVGGFYLPLSPIVPPFSPIVPLLVSLCWMIVSAFLRVLSPLVCNGILLVSLCWMVCPQCTPSCFPLLDGVSAFSRVLSPLVSHCTPFVSFSRMVCPPSEGLVSLCLPLCPFLFRLVGPCLPLSPLVSPLCPFLFFFVGWCCPPCRGSCLPWSPHCTRSCLPLLDGVSAFPRNLVSPSLRLYPGPLLVSTCWMVCPPFRGSFFFLFFCLPLSPIVPLLVSLCWIVCPPSPGCPPFSPLLVSLCWIESAFSGGLVSLCLPLYPFFFTFVGWCVRLPEHLVPPSLHIISLSSRQCAALLRVPNAFLRCSPWSCLPLSPTQCLPSCFLFVGWCVRVPGTLSHLSPVVSPHVCLCWMNVFTFSMSCISLVSPMFPIVSPHVCLCWMVRPPSWRLVSHCPPLPPIVSHCLPACVPVLDGVFCLVCLCWCVRLTPRSCPPLSPIKPIVPLSPHTPVPVVGWCVVPPEVLPTIVSIVSPHVCLCWMVRPPSCRLVFPFLSPIVSLLGLSLSPVVSNCFPLSPCGLSLSPHIVCLCWMVRLLEVLFFIVSLEMCACVGASALDGVSAFPRSCLPFCLVSHLPSCFPLLDGVSAFPMSCLGLSPIVLLTCAPVLCGLSASPGSCLHLSPIVPPIVSHCLPSCLPVSPCLRLCAIVSHCPTTCAPVLDGVSAFRGLVSPLSLIVSPHWCPCWMVSPPWIISAFNGPCLRLSPIVSPHVCLCWMVCPPSQGFVSLVSQFVFLLVPQLVSQLVFLLVSLWGWWSDFAFFSNSEVYC